jgi:glucoamylase
MLPEQVWDYADLPSEELYFGRSAGSAQPLVWAHAEYLKLLKSVTDNKVFDRISVVHERYDLNRDPKPRRHISIFKLNRPISVTLPGAILRIMDADLFTVLYTTNNWATQTSLDAHPVGHLGAYADIPIASDQTSSIIFTLHWSEENRWLGHNYEVTIHTVLSQGTAADKPKV